MDISGIIIPICICTLPADSETGELLIKNHTDANVGSYMCEAKNAVGRAECRYELHAYNRECVFWPAGAKYLLSQPSDEHVAQFVARLSQRNTSKNLPTESCSLHSSNIC